MKNFLGFILLINSFVHGQQHLSPDLITFPVSPEAARMVTYGNTPVNLCYGQLDKSIELFNGKIGNFDFPINLVYSYAGFRVQDTPSIIGLGWQLTIGGVITREVRGYPDEHPKGYYASGQEGVETFFNTNTMLYHQAESIMRGEYDGEVDLYTVSVNGINFSFKIGLNGQAVFLAKNDYKVEITKSATNNNDIISFTVTDTNGNKYLFSEREFTQRVEGYDAVFQDNFPKYCTSWQLTSITTSERNLISYTYQNDDFYSYSYYASGNNGINMNQYGHAPASNYYSEGSAKDLIQRKLLTNIKCSNFNVVFTLSIENEQDVYSKMIVKDKNLKIINDYDFKYTEVRNTLTEIKKNNKFFYGFTYQWGSFVPGYPSSIQQIRWDQDFWGFYNGKQNTYAFSRPANSIVNPLNSDRSSDYGSTVIGALSVIRYPTGGYTQIHYEQNTIAAPQQSAAQPNVRTVIKFQSDNSNTSPAIKEWTFTKTFDAPTIVRMSHRVETTNHSDIEIQITRREGSCAGNYDINVPNERTRQNTQTPVVCPYFYFNFNDGVCESCIFEGNSGGTFLIRPGTYDFKFHTYFNFKPVTAIINLDYYRPDIEGSISQVNINTGGIRVRQTIDYPQFGEPVTTYYDYNSTNGISTATVFSQLVNEVSYRTGMVYNGNLIFSPTNSAIEYTATPYNLLLKRGIPVYYKSVKTYTKKLETFVPNNNRFLCDQCQSSGVGGTYPSTYIGTSGYGTRYIDYPYGYTQTNFTSKIKESSYPFEPKGNDDLSGRVSEEYTYGPADIEHNHAMLSNVTTRYYDNELSNRDFVNATSYYPKSLKLGYKIRLTDWAQSFTNSNLTLNDCFYVRVYKEADTQAQIWDTTTREYFGESYTEKLSSNEYDNHRQLKKQTVINNLNQGLANYERLTTELYYPYDFNDAVSQAMVSRNVMTPLVKVETKRDGEVLETTQYKYLDVNGSGLFKPTSFSKGKGGNQPEERMNYSYDDKGNISVISKEDVRPNLQGYLSKGKTMIIWGYNKSLPIAKIENIDSGVGTITELQRLSDLDVDNSSTCSGSSCTELQLRAALDNLRTLYPNALITTYTHDPLIGITSMTDPRGRRTTYEYDDQGRLVRARDHQGNILSENSYHFVTEN